MHCGFCLPTCPTYVLWGEEMDSPRGRIYLMKEGLEGEPMSDSMVSHWDACLGCMACVTSCPSGVQYDTLIEQTRAQVERRHERSRKDKALRGLVFSLFPYPKRLRLARGPLRAMQKTGLDRAMRRTGLLDKLAPQLAAMERLAPRLGKPEKLPTHIPATGTRRAVVGLLTGCVQGAFFPGVNAATARVLQAEGCDVVVPKSQGCCGALSVHNGREPEGQAFARGLDRLLRGIRGRVRRGQRRRLRLDDEGLRQAAGRRPGVRRAGARVRRPGPRRRRDPRRAGPRRSAAPAGDDASPTTTPVTSATRRASGPQPRRLLEAIPGLELKEIAEAELCCGSAGIYNIVNPEPAQELGDRKAANIVATGAQVLVTANPGCLMQVTSAIERSGHPMGMAHTVEVLDASIRGAPASTLLPA